MQHFKPLKDVLKVMQVYYFVEKKFNHVYCQLNRTAMVTVPFAASQDAPTLWPLTSLTPRPPSPAATLPMAMLGSPPWQGRTLSPVGKGKLLLSVSAHTRLNQECPIVTLQGH